MIRTSYRQSIDVSHPYKSKVTMGEDCPDYKDDKGLCGKIFITKPNMTKSC